MTEKTETAGSRLYTGSIFKYAQWNRPYATKPSRKASSKSRTHTPQTELKQYGLVPLEDDKQLFPPYQGAPLMRQETLDAHPELKEILEQLSGRITEEEMSAMNYDVRVNKRKARDVAIEYLKNNGLI